MRRQIVRIVAMILMALAVALPVGAQDATPEAGSADHADVQAATTWLMDQQLDNGAFAGFTGEADAGTTVDAIMALAAAEQSGVDVGTSLDDAIGYLSEGDVALVYEQIGVGQAAKLALALIAVGENPAEFSGFNPVSIVENGQNDETGIYGSGLYDHAYAMMVLSATDQEIPANALDALTATQAENGGWAFDGSTDAANADSNTTAMLVQALVASGNVDHETMAPALEFLASTVTADGAAYAPGSDADSNSTAMVLQAMIATGGETTGLQTSLATFQTDSGSFFYQAADPSDNLFSAVQSIPAAAGYALPIVPASDATPVALFLDLAA